MSEVEARILSLTVRLFTRLPWYSREWLLARLAADHRDLLKNERHFGRKAS